MIKNKDYILCSAILIDENKIYPNQPINIKTGFIVCGYRHSNCIASAVALLRTGVPNKITPGFLTSNNEFLTRTEAAEYAFKAKQISRKIDSLCSEDLY